MESKGQQEKFRHPILPIIEFYLGQNYNLLIILRGLPGSGKSTLAKSILAAFGNNACCICSADDFFYSPTGEYDYNPTFISNAHVQCRKKVSSCMLDCKPVVIIDNTNIKTSEFVSYLPLAATHNYLSIVTEPNTYWKFDVVQLAQRNVHSVPKKKLQELRKNFEQLRLVDDEDGVEQLPNEVCNVGAKLANALVNDSRHGNTVYCLKVLQLPKVNSVHTRSQARHQPMDQYRQPEMVQSFNDCLRSVAHVNEWRSLFETRPQQTPSNSVGVDADLAASSLCSNEVVADAQVCLVADRVAAIEEDDNSAYLASIFPDFDAEVLIEMYRANENDLTATIEQLNQLSEAYKGDAKLPVEDDGAGMAPLPVSNECSPSLLVSELVEQQQSGVEFSVGLEESPKYVANRASKSPVAAEVKNMYSDDQALSGFITKTNLMALHERFGKKLNSKNNATVGNLLSEVGEDFLADWTPPDEVLSLIYLAFLDHIGVSAQQQQKQRQPVSSYSSPALSDSRWRASDPLSSRINLDRLFRAFPGLSEDAAASLLADCGNSYEAAFATLLECGLEPATEPDGAAAASSAVFKKSPSPIAAAASSSTSSDEATKLGGLFDQLNLVSADYRAQRRDYLTKAAYAKDPRAQGHYMRQAGSLAQQERQERAELVGMATRSSGNNLGIRLFGSREKQLDLHGMNASEAIQALKTTMNSSSSSGLKTIKVITGHGKHSNSGPVLRPVVRNFLQQKCIQFEEPHLGCFELRLT
ncbi:hypothetical protein BOX15_Mlig033661g1 [Macrostomum lignano]|uniref:Smr domain-containing protein n=2 Tax=Macrostomum lignano TaxID=282301 RepID=A0A1I8J4N6_9PLAT|nr:hypothetical protein BOX15_Mlig033661g1 [Macrostomum lignano]